MGIVFRRKKEKITLRCSNCGAILHIEGNLGMDEIFSKIKKNWDEKDLEKSVEELNKSLRVLRKIKCPKCGNYIELPRDLKAESIESSIKITSIKRTKKGLFGKEVYTVCYSDNKGNKIEKSFNSKKEFKEWLKKNGLISTLKFDF